MWLGSGRILLDATQKRVVHPAGLVLVVVVKHELIYVLRYLLESIGDPALFLSRAP